jgi:hypothetical protein
MNFKEGKIKKILYSIVMIEESNAILENEKFIKESDLTKQYSNILEAFTLKKDDTELILIRPIVDPMHSTSLFGTEISFMITYTGIQLFSPDVVISIGYAGEVSLGENDRKLGLGSVVVAKENGVYHRREMLIKFFENTSQGLYPVNSCLKMVESLGYHSCSVGTSNSFVNHDHVAVEKKIKVVEMELCSVARACYYFKVPCIGIKIISDSGDVASPEQRIKEFLDALPLLKQKFFETFEKVNKFLFSQEISEL